MFDKKEWDSIKFWIYQAIFFSAVVFLSCSAWKVNSLKCVWINNQECKVRSEIININSNELLFYPYSILLKNAVVVVIVLMTHMQNYVFLMLLKT